MQTKTKELLKPKYDVVFQSLFQGNKENITENLISDILGEKVKILEIRSDEKVIREYLDEKSGRLDLKTKFEDGTICQIEMQLAREKSLIERILYYWAKTYSSQLKRGEPFSKLERTIGIVITDFEIKEMDGIERLDTKWQIMESEEGKRILTNRLEIRIIEIPKAKRIIEKEKGNKIAQWMMFLDNPNTKGVEKIMKENEEVKKAVNVLYEMSEDEKLRRLAYLKERAIMEEESARIEWTEDGYVKGKKEIQKELIKNMIKENISIDVIIKITGLSKEEIENIIK